MEPSLIYLCKMVVAAEVPRKLAALHTTSRRAPAGRNRQLHDSNTVKDGSLV
jgi:hypothetical protein